MDWVKLSTRYPDDLALLRAGEAAEVLFLRALAWSGSQETAGFIPTEALPRIVQTKAQARVRALIDQDLWETVDGGWRITGWDRHQVTDAQLEERRRQTRERQTRHRGRAKATSNGVRNGVTNADVTPLEVEQEVDAAAAAARVTKIDDLPEAVAILRSRLEAHKLTVRWDRLTAEHVTEIAGLVETHGDVALVRAALQAWRPDNPLVFAQGWISHWAQLRAPGSLAAVADPPCTEPGHTGTTTRCAQCAAEKHAGGLR